MKVKQLSVFVENKTAALSEVINVLGDVNMRALSIADTAEFGILRLIVDNPEAAAQQLTDNGYICKITEVLAFAMKDEKGGLAGILKVLAEANVSLEYAYAFLTGKTGEAGLIVRAADENKATAALAAAGIRAVSQEELF